MEPFFSIVIPTYNRALLLPAAIESVIAQTFSNWELIIVDDGSTDNTREVVSSYPDKRIKYIYQNNAERSAARNNGIGHSDGTYICFLDSDDYYLPERLESLYKKLDERGFPVAAFYTGIVLVQGEKTMKIEPQVTSENVFDLLALSVIHSQQCCIHRSILEVHKYDTAFHIGEDMELWLRIAAAFPFTYLPDAHSVAVVDHEDRSVNVKKYNSYPDQMRMLNRIFAEDHSGRKISESVQRTLKSNCYFGIARFCIYNGLKFGAIKNLAMAIATCPGHFQNKYRLNLIVRLLLPKGIEQAKKLLE